MVSTSLKGENINLWRIFKLIKSKKYETLLHKSIQTYYGLFDQRTTEASVLQGVAPQQHSNEKVHRGEVQSEYADPHLGDVDTDDEQEAVAENGYGILRPDADYRSEVQPTIQQED